MLLASFIQEINIEEKVKNAPDSNYEIGLFIGSMLPFVVLVLIAYMIYKHYKNSVNKE